MPNGAREASVTATADVALPLATETVVVTLPGITTRTADEIVRLAGWLQVTTGVGGTTVTLRVRRGTAVTGTLIGEGNAINVGASVTQDLTLDVQDTPGEVSGQAYVLTATAAGAAATAIQSRLEATIGG